MLPASALAEVNGSGPGLGERRLELDEVRALVRRELPALDDGAVERVAESLHALCAGWPRLVHAALEHGTGPWTGPGDARVALSRPADPVARWVLGHLLPLLPGSAAGLLRTTAALDPLPRELVETLERGGDLPAGSRAAYQLLTADGLVGSGASATDASVIPLVASVLTATGWDVEQSTSIFRTASRWYLRHGLPGAALRASALAGDDAAVAEIATAWGDRILADGDAVDLAATLSALHADVRTLRLEILHGHAARLAGRPVEAERLLRAALVQAQGPGGDRTPPPDLAWRLGWVHYGRADYVEAIAVLQGERFPLAPDEPATDRARRCSLLAWAYLMLGDHDLAAGHVEDARTAAGESEDDGALAAAFQAEAELLTGARRHNALAAGLAAAERSGDVFARQRALVNLADAKVLAGEYTAAIEVAERAVTLGQRTGPRGCFIIGLHNLGEARLLSGDLAGARLCFLRCLDTARRHGLDRTPGALWGLALVEYHAGRLADARTAFEEVLDLARDTGERQFLATTLAYLSIVAVTAPVDSGDLFRAVGWAEEAAAGACERLRALTTTARGWVLLATGDLDGAAVVATEALGQARRHGTLRALGPAYELLAAARQDPADSEAALDEALVCYQRSGERLAADRVLVSLGRLPGRWGRRGASARAAARRLARAGVSPAPIHPTGRFAPASVEIRIMGGFTVTRNDQPVPNSAWRSRQARTLLKLLVARHGRPLGREEACDLLWPDDDPEKTGHRLSVLLSSLRNALSPDRARDVDPLIEADSHGIRLVLDQVSIDLRDFLEDAHEVARLAEAGDERGARALVADVVAAYEGEAFEDDPYEAWASDTRDHVRAVTIRTLRLGARLAGRAGDIDQAVTLLLRVLAADPFDEPAHRMLVSVLVRAGRHGEAERALSRWSRAMVEVGAEPPSRDILGRTTPVSTRVLTTR